MFNPPIFKNTFSFLSLRYFSASGLFFSSFFFLFTLVVLFRFHSRICGVRLLGEGGLGVWGFWILAKRFWSLLFSFKSR
jgi:hypothetical protein